MIRGRHTRSLFPQLGLGMGLRASHFDFVLENHPALGWFEAITENFMGIESGFGGRPLEVLERVRSKYPIAFHGVSLSIASTDPFDANYLKKWKVLVDRFEPVLVSDHLCWTGVAGNNLHDLLPVPFTEEAMSHLVERVDLVQNYLGRRILLENVSSYLTYEHSEMAEWEFLTELSQRADCGLLLDVNNVYVSSVNHGFDPKVFIDAIPVERVGQFHLAGYTDNGNHLVDTHDHPVSAPVWELYAHTIRRFGPVSTLLERDANIPSFEELMTELSRAKEIQNEVADEALSAPRAAMPAFPSAHPS